MTAYTIRGAEPGDCGAITAVYNSGPDFLRAHLGTELVTEPFILAELAQMRALGFRSCVIEDGESGEIQGVLDYRPGGEVYLSLLMLRAELHRSGAGRAVYTGFEEEMRRTGASSIRIDVVRGHEGDAAPFWRRMGFVPAGEAELCWGQQRSSAVIMRKHLYDRRGDR